MEKIKLIRPVEIALDMEKDGLKYYLESAGKAYNKLIKDLLNSLAKDEEEHHNSFLNIYDSFKKNNKWPDDLKIKANRKSRTIFKKYADKNRKDMISAKNEMDIVRKALEIERKSFEFYKELSGEIKENNIKIFFDKLAEIENEHYELLDDTYNYLNNPAEWFIKEEKPIFEGQ